MPKHINGQIYYSLQEYMVLQHERDFYQKLALKMDNLEKIDSIFDVVLAIDSIDKIIAQLQKWEAEAK